MACLKSGGRAVAVVRERDQKRRKNHGSVYHSSATPDPCFPALFSLGSSAKDPSCLPETDLHAQNAGCILRPGTDCSVYPGSLLRRGTLLAFSEKTDILISPKRLQ